MPNLVLEHDLRRAVFSWLDQLRVQTGGEVTAESLRRFMYGNQEVSLLHPAGRGIHGPLLLGDDRAALTLLTAAPVSGKAPPYDDGEADDKDYFLYKYQKDGADAFDNRMVRRAMQCNLRLVYFRGVAKGRYEAFYPIAVTHDDAANETFHLCIDPDAGLLSSAPAAADISSARRYATRAAKVRLHQAVFRERVLTAYVDSCAVCRIKHRVLLDAAHITPDSAAHATAEVTNGISMCKIHHAAYDAHLLGITPDYRVAINSKLLEEVDGPMLQYGLKERHNERIKLPVHSAKRPDRDRLRERYELFLQR
jgi:putative restriction endonuclease